MITWNKRVLIPIGVVIIAGLVAVNSCEPPGPPEQVIKGAVTDASTGQPISGARVSDDGYGPAPSWGVIRAGDCAPWGAVTDSLGTYRYLTWPEHHSIKATAAGYKTQRKSLYDSHFVLNKKSEEVIDFALERE